MPNRILKQSICTSRNINSLSLGAETLFYRILVNCDDYGQFHADPEIIRGYCLPLRKVDTDTVLIWLDELAAADLLWLYDVDEVRYLQVTKWESHQQIRSKRHKFPEPPSPDINGNHLISDDINCKQVISLAPVIQSNPNQSESSREAKKPAAPAAPPKIAQPKTSAEPKPELLVVSLPHGTELQAALDKHFGSKQKSRHAWKTLASCEQVDAYRAAANALDSEFMELVVKGLGRERDSRSALLAWLETCVKNKNQPSGAHYAARQQHIPNPSGNPNAGRYKHAPFDPTRDRVKPI